MTRPWLLVPLLIAALDASASSLRCGNALVGPGKTALELITLCGAPAHVARRVLVTGDHRQRVTEEVETWTYVGDTGELMRAVEIRRGAIASVTVLGHRPERSACDRTFSAGTPVATVELTCGAPSDRSAWVEELRGGRRIVAHERWIYDLGPGRFLRVIELENGRVTRMTTASRSPQ